MVSKVKHVLLTGFEPFGDPLPKDNRSWEAVKALSNEEIQVNSDTTVHCHVHRLPVSYKPVSEMVPILDKEESYSLIIHCGAGVPGVVRLEKQAHKSGYTRHGNGGPSDLPKGGSAGYPEMDDILVSRIDVEAVRSGLRENGWESVCVNEDPGRYLCDFTYYTSLAEAARMSGNNVPLVLFVHVPPYPMDPYSDEELSQVIRDIIKIVL